MKDIFHRLWINIKIIFVTPILFVLDIFDAFFAERKYRQLYYLTRRIEGDYHMVQKLFFSDGGYMENKDRILNNSKILKIEAKATLIALEKLYNDWGEFFDERSKSTMEEEMESLKAISRFGEQNCNP